MVGWFCGYSGCIPIRDYLCWRARENRLLGVRHYLRGKTNGIGRLPTSAHQILHVRDRRLIGLQRAFQSAIEQRGDTVLFRERESPTAERIKYHEGIEMIPTDLFFEMRECVVCGRFVGRGI